MTTFTANDVAAQRDRVRQIESKHADAQATATSWLADVKTAVETDGAARPTREQVEEKFAEADKLALDLDSERAVLARMYEGRNGADAADQRPGTDAAAFLASLGAGLPGGRRASAGARFVQSDEFLAAAQGGGDAVKRMKDIPVLSADELVASIQPMAATVDGSPLVADDQTRIDQLRGLPVRQPTLLGWIRVGTTDSDVVRYTRQTVDTAAFADFNPLTNTEVAITDATITYVAESEDIRDRAQGLPVPVRNLADSGRMRSLIDGRLVGMARRDMEQQVISGDGVGENMTGITNWSGVGSYTRVTGDSVADAMHKGITVVRTSLLEEPDGIAYSAADLEKITLEKASDGQYINSGGPFAPYLAMVWGKRSTVAHVLAATTSIIGKWDEDELVVREGVSVREFEQHSDFAAKGLTYMRTTYRATNVIERAQAFAVVTTTDPV